VALNPVAVVAQDHPAVGTLNDSDMARAAREDASAFAALYQSYHGRLYRYLRTRVPTDEDAADLVQQVFVHVLDAIPTYRSTKGTFVGWLFRIARNAATDWNRRHKPMLTWDRLPEELHPHIDVDMDAELARRGDVVRVRKLLNSLPLERREIVALRFAGGLTIPEIAAALGKGEKATRKKLARTLRKLEELYDEG